MGKSKNKPKTKLTKFDQIILKSIPKTFELLGWTAILGVLQYVSIKSDDYGMWIVYLISLLGFMLYIQVYVFNEIFLKIKTKNNWISLLILMLTAVIGLGTYLFLNRIIDLLAINN